MEQVKPKKTAPTRRAPEHYVNNKEFSQAVMDYVKEVNAQKEAALKKNPKLTKSELKEIGPVISEYIGSCFLKISEGLSHKPNFIRYTYREEMVMDAVENCIKAIMNYSPDAATRSGNPNAFAYFTQICYFAFIRRITKEKKQQDIKLRYIQCAGIEDFMTNPDGGEIQGDTGFIEVLKHRIERVKQTDKAIKVFKKKVVAEDKKKGVESFM